MSIRLTRSLWIRQTTRLFADQEKKKIRDIQEVRNRIAHAKASKEKRREQQGGHEDPLVAQAYKEIELEKQGIKVSLTGNKKFENVKKSKTFWKERRENRAFKPVNDNVAAEQLD